MCSSNVEVPDEALPIASASCSRPTRRRRARRSPRRAAREAGPVTDPRLRGRLAGRRSDRAPRPGSTSRPRPRLAGAWLELSVAADHEAVEAVSEILAARRPAAPAWSPRSSWSRRGSPRGWTSPAPHSSAPTCRSSIRAPIRAAVAQAERELGHLQAFGLRPIGDLAATVVHEARLGERLEGALPGPADRAADRHPADLAAPPPPAR